MSADQPDIACSYCERTRSTCRRIPGGCCGVCDHAGTEGVGASFSSSSANDPPVDPFLSPAFFSVAVCVFCALAGHERITTQKRCWGETPIPTAGSAQTWPLKPGPTRITNPKE